ncbi:MAG: hypothetical protein HY238_21205 [Acidobacteria bacterium]|nr:hypothetical protein [Acidobacteriota bacterium]
MRAISFAPAAMAFFCSSSGSPASGAAVETARTPDSTAVISSSQPFLIALLA